MTPNFARPVFSSGPNNSFATMDMAAAKAGGILNSVQDLAKKYDVDLASVIRGAQQAAELLPLFTTKGSGFVTNKGNLMSRIISANKQISGLISRGAAIAGFDENVFSSYLGTENGDVFAKVGDLVQRVAYTDFKSMSDIGYLINDLATEADPNAGNLFKMDDQDSTVAFLVGTIREATQYGIPNSFSTLSATIQNSSTMNRVIDGVLPDAIAASDLDMLIDMANSRSRDSVIHRYPDVLRRIGDSYKSTPMETAHERYERAEKVYEAFDAIDFDWDKMKRGADTVFSTAKMKLDNAEFLDTMRTGALGSGDTRKSMWLIAEKYPNQDVFSSLKKDFPMTVIDPTGDFPQTDTRNLTTETFAVKPNTPINVVNL